MFVVLIDNSGIELEISNVLRHCLSKPDKIKKAIEKIKQSSFCSIPKLNKYKINHVKKIGLEQNEFFTSFAYRNMQSHMITENYKRIINCLCKNILLFENQEELFLFLLNENIQKDCFKNDNHVYRIFETNDFNDLIKINNDAYNNVSIHVKEYRYAKSLSHKLSRLHSECQLQKKRRNRIYWKIFSKRRRN